jgi:Flp pilus assembly protein TadD
MAFSSFIGLGQKNFSFSRLLKSWYGLLLQQLIAIFIVANAFGEIPVDRPEMPKDAEIVSIRGESWIRFVRSVDWLKAMQSQDLTAGDSLRTGNFGKMDVLFVDGTQIKIHQKSTLLIKNVRSPDAQRNTILKLERGEVWSRTKAGADGLRIETPSATAAIRGTDWDLLVDDQGISYLTVLKGTVVLFNDYGEVTASGGEQAMAEPGKPPIKLFLVKPRDRVQWIRSYALNVPEMMKFHSHQREYLEREIGLLRDAAHASPVSVKNRVRFAGLLYDAGERKESAAITDEILKEAPQDCEALLIRGFLRLEDGDAEAAGEDFRSVLASGGSAERERAMIGLIGVHYGKNELNDVAGILEKLRQTGASPEAGILDTQFRAFRGDFTGAVESCRQYESKHPDDDRFPAAAADFLLALDEKEEAKQAINRALSINFDSPAALTILGRYNYLEGKADESEKAYRKAIEQDPSNVAARTELGRLLMEMGHFERSLKELTRATEITPYVSSLWS